MLANFLCLWCRVLVEATSRFHGLVGWAFVAEAVGWGWVACMFARAEDVDCLPKLCEPQPFSVNILPRCFRPLGPWLSSNDGLLLLMNPLDLLLHSRQLLFYGSFTL
jgi:hypothetical protein